MRIPRIYFDQPIHLNTQITLGVEESGHLLRVLRLTIGDELNIFDGKGHEYLANISDTSKKHVVVTVLETSASLPPSPLYIHLAQGISRSDKMDYSLQKSVELGVNAITPLLTERGSVKLLKDRVEKKMSHWEKVIISACEQCGRSDLPTLMPIQSLPDWLEKCSEQLRFVLTPSATSRLKNIAFNNNRIVLLIGPESGLSEHEIHLAKQHDFSPLQLGPRILRTETAGPTAIAALQCLWGDF